MPKGTRLELPQAQERAAYVVEGAVACDTERAEAGRMLVFTPGSTPVLHAESNVRVALIGGAPIDGPRHIWWNFASSSKERIEVAKQGWREGRFPKVPGDEKEFIPLPTTRKSSRSIPVRREARHMLRIVGIAGSLRKASYNAALLRAAVELAPPV